MPGREFLLTALANPTIALLLLAVGILGACWELSRIGLIVPGVLGSVCVVLALGCPAARAFDVPGLVLVAASLVCFVLEATLRSRGVLTLGGAAAMLAGVRMIDRNIGWAVATAAVVLVSGLISFRLSIAFRARQNKLGILRNGDAARL